MPASLTAPSRAPIAAAPPSIASPLPTLGTWQLVALLGSGAWTSVYQARPADCTSNVGADYAVKALKPEFQGCPVAIDLLRREAAIAAAISHPHLTTVLTWHLSKSPRYLVMPRLNGGTVQQLLYRSDNNEDQLGNPLPVPHALWIARQVCEALLRLHCGGWIHGDIKPSNIFVSPHGHVTLIDLGFARKISSECSTADNSDQRNPLAASLAYAAPEVLAENRANTAASDIYSLGITLFEMVTGQRPYPTHDRAGLIDCHLRHSPPDPKPLAPNLWPRVIRLIQRMLDKDPTWRPQLKELHEVLVRLEIETLPERA